LISPTPTGRDWKDGSAKACANIPVNGLLGACARMFVNANGDLRRASNHEGEVLEAAVMASLGANVWPERRFTRNRQPRS
jgi:hypothetical protein